MTIISAVSGEIERRVNLKKTRERQKACRQSASSAPGEVQVNAESGASVFYIDLVFAIITIMIIIISPTCRACNCAKYNVFTLKVLLERFCHQYSIAKLIAIPGK